MLGWVSGLSTLSALLIRPLAGQIIDRVGRKWIFLIGTAIILAVTGAYLCVASVALILVLRFIHGIGWGFASTASNTIATDNIPRNRFSMGMGIFSLSISLALAIAPALSLSLELPIVVVVAFICTTLAIVLVAGIRFSPISAVPKGKRGAAFEKSSIVPSICMFMVTTTYGAIVTFLAMLGQEKSIVGIGLFFTVYSIAMIASRPIVGKLTDQYGFGVGMWPGVALLFTGMLLLAYASTIKGVAFAAFLYGVGYGAAQNSLQTLAVVSASPERRGAANATFFVAFDGGIGFGAVIGSLIAAVAGYTHIFTILSVCPLLMALLYWRWTRTI